MKRYLLLIALYFVATGVHSQFDANFGFISSEEANLKVCDYDPEASAVILLSEAYSEYTPDDELLTFYHQRIKILKEDGVRYGDVKLHYRSNNEFETLDNIEAMTIKVDENGIRRDIPVDEKSIYVKNVNKYRTEVSFAFPDVKPGVILEYKYRVTAKNYGGIRDWYFQSDIPVNKSSYRLKIVPGHEVSYLVQYNPQYKVGVTKIGSDNAVKFEMNRVPALTDEPYMDAREDYIQKVIFQTTKFRDGNGGTDNFMSTWKEVISELNGRSDFGRQMKLKIDECQEFINTSLTGKSDIEKLQLVHHYVSGNLSWDGFYSLTADNGIKNLWKKKTGNSAEINLLLVNLLRQAGLEAYPMLVSERGHGKVNKDQPFIDQFNNVFAVVFANNRKYYLDATDKFTSSLLTPVSILNTTAFIVDHKVGGIADIQESEARYSDNINILASMNENGELAGSVHLESKDYARTEKLREYVSHKSDYVDSYIKADMANIDVNNFNAKNAEEESMPFMQDFDFKTNVQSTGEYAFLSMNMFTGLQTNPFILNDRFSHINFGFKKTINLTYNVNLPSNYKIDALPKNIRLVTPDNSITLTRQFFVENNKLLAKVNVNIDKTMFSVDQYPAIKDFFKQMVNMLNEQVVLKKK